MNTTNSIIASSVGVNYFNSMSCTWSITAPVGYRTQLSFSSISTEPCCDFIALYNGTTQSGPLLRLIQGTVAAFTYTSVGRSVTVRFTSDAQTTSTGFQALVTFVGEFNRRLLCADTTSHTRVVIPSYSGLS